MKRQTPYVIDIPLEEPSRMSPALGQIDRLLKQHLLQTQSLQVVRHMLMQEMLDRAQTNGHSKLLAAVTVRQEHTGEVEPPAPKKPTKVVFGLKSRQKEELAKTHITGPRLNLFILELAAKSNAWLTGADILRILRATGKADHINRLSGVFGLLSAEGFLKHAGKKGYHILNAGKAFAKRLRKQLEETGAVQHGTYLAPPTYKLQNNAATKPRLGYKTVKRHMKLE